MPLSQEELCNHSWQSVQARLLALQRRQPLCVPRRELTELDIHHRILRFRNYTVAMVNKSLLPVRFRLPLLGPVVFLTRGLQFNLELLLFRGPAALFQNTWSLRPQVKRAGARRALARGLARAAVLLGVANLALCPCVLGWRLLLAFFSYAEGLKRAPGSLGARRWSLYARHYLRHFNELGHELQARLGRGHAPATKYMDSFSSPLLAVLARHVGFFAGSVLAVLIVLTVYDEDVLTVQHILTAITLLGLVVTVARCVLGAPWPGGCWICGQVNGPDSVLGRGPKVGPHLCLPRSFIPDEHAVWCPEQLLQRVLAHVHYLPEHWQGRAGRAETRAEMAQLFQYKAVGAAPRSPRPFSPDTPSPGTMFSPLLLPPGPCRLGAPHLGLPISGSPAWTPQHWDPLLQEAIALGLSVPVPCPETPPPPGPHGLGASCARIPYTGIHHTGTLLHQDSPILRHPHPRSLLLWNLSL